MGRAKLLSVCIPARNEMWLNNTIQDVLKNRRGDTECIVILDGQWPVEPIPDHPDVHLVFHADAVGQRAGVNEAVSLSSAKYIMKLDAHCSVDEGFDVKLAEPYETKELDRTDTTIPRLVNLHVFTWVCKACGNERYQGPTQEVCQQCQGKNTQERRLEWKPRWHKVSDFMRFDTDMKFTYWSKYKTRPEAQGELCDVMGGLGAFFFMTRDRFWELGGMDLRHGQWGQMGTCVSCKSWLSGGRQVVNRRTFATHCFRTSGGDFGFPFPMSNAQVEKAREHSKWLWLGNNWEGQVRPLSWLVDRFSPVPSWHDAEGAATLEMVRVAGASFAPRQKRNLALRGEAAQIAGLVVSELPFLVADLAAPMVAGDGDGHKVPIAAMGLGVSSGGHAGSAQDVFGVTGQPEMGGIAAGHVVADDVVKDRNVAPETGRRRRHKPRVHQPVGDVQHLVDANVSVASATGGSSPFPATSESVDTNLREDFAETVSVEAGDARILVSHSVPPCQAADRSEAGRATTRPASTSIIAPAPPAAILYYSDNALDPSLLGVCQRQLLRARGTLPIYSVTLKPMDFGDVRIVLPGERGALQLFKQILAGLEAMPPEVETVLLAEHDVLYPPEHFVMTQESSDFFYYDRSRWQVDATTGRAVFFMTYQTAGLFAHRMLLLEHYRARVARVEREGRFDKRIGHEPGLHKAPRGIDMRHALSARCDVPYIDLRHAGNFTGTRWSTAQFRDKRTCEGWVEADRVPGWGQTASRMFDFLRDLDEVRVA